MAKGRDGFRFEGFEINLQGGDLRKDGERVALEPQPFQVLAMLVARAGEIVTRDEIRSELWSDGTTVEFDLGLNYCIRQVRRALWDDVRSPRYVETIRKRGYRFLAAVTPEYRDARTELKIPRLPKRKEAAKPFREAEHLSTTWELDKTKQAVELYREVIRLDPDFPDAYAALANALVILPFMGGPADTGEAESHAQQALRMNESLPLAHVALAHGYWHQWKWEQADLAFSRALELDPESAVALQLHGLYQATRGRCDVALASGRKAAELEPTAGVILYSLGQIYLQSGRFEEAIQQHRQTLKLSRHYPISYASMVRAYSMKGDLDAVERTLQEWERVNGPSASGTWRAYWLARSGQCLVARQAFDRWRESASPAARASLSAAIAWVALGEIPLALDALSEGVRQHNPTMIWLKIAPELEPLRSLPRYFELLEAMGRP